MSDTPIDVDVIEMAAEIVSAYVRNNSVPVADLPLLLKSVHESLGSVLKGPEPEAAKAPLQPKVPVRKSITHDYIICLEDGKRFKSLKRHLHSAYGLSPQEYREKWGLPKDYPMVAPAYADARSNLAKTMGLGRKAGGAPSPAMPESDAADPEPVAETQPDAEGDAAPPDDGKKPRRGRAKAAA